MYSDVAFHVLYYQFEISYKIGNFVCFLFSNLKWLFRAYKCLLSSYNQEVFPQSAAITGLSNYMPNIQA